MITLPGGYFAPEVILADLAKKLRGCELSSGSHEIIIFCDGSVVVNGTIQWKPKALMVATTQKKKVG